MYFSKLFPGNNCELQAIKTAPALINISLLSENHNWAAHFPLELAGPHHYGQTGLYPLPYPGPYSLVITLSELTGPANQDHTLQVCWISSSSSAKDDFNYKETCLATEVTWNTMFLNHILRKRVVRNVLIKKSWMRSTMFCLPTIITSSKGSDDLLQDTPV